jgi:hypothetical protein
MSSMWAKKKTRKLKQKPIGLAMGSTQASESVLSSKPNHPPFSFFFPCFLCSTSTQTDFPNPSDPHMLKKEPSCVGEEMFVQAEQVVAIKQIGANEEEIEMGCNSLQHSTCLP